MISFTNLHYFFEFANIFKKYFSNKGKAAYNKGFASLLSDTRANAHKQRTQSPKPLNLSYTYTRNVYNYTQIYVKILNRQIINKKYLSLLV